MEISKVLIAAIFLSLVGVSLALWTGELATNYNLSSPNLSFFNKSKNLTETLNSTASKLQTTQWYERIPIFGVVFSFGKILWTGARVIWAIGDILFSSTSDLLGMIGLPEWMLGLFTGLVLIVLIVAFLRVFKGGV